MGAGIVSCGAGHTLVVEVIAVSGGAYLFMGFESRIKLINKIETIVGIIFPGVFAIEDHTHYGRFIFCGMLRDARDLIDKMMRGVFAVPA